MNTPNNDNNKQSGLSWSAPASTPKVLTPKPAAPVAVSSSNRNASKIAGWLAVGVVAGVVIAWGATSLFKRGGESLPAVADNLQTATTTKEILFNVPSPQKAGMKVEVNGTEISAPTWVVVYESRDGKPGNVLGAALFSTGQEGGMVDLLRRTIAGQSYFVTEQSDNGDRRFSLKEDALLTAQGEPLWITFIAN
ncbi:MAG: hypothetical protein AAB919_01000 [Patescibacteria group bacterium]